MIQVRNPTGFMAGLLSTVMGGVTLLVVWEYPVGTAVRMGPGYWPRLLGCLLVALGVGLVLWGLRQDGPQARPVTPRPVLCVLLSIALFALTIESLGLVIAIFLSVAAAAIGSRECRPVEVALLAVALIVFSTLVFVLALGLPIPLMPSGVGP